jgi:hypothetical protein
MNAIEVAYAGRKAMLRAIFGSSDETEPPPLTPSAFRLIGGKS